MQTDKKLALLLSVGLLSVSLGANATGAIAGATLPEQITQELTQIQQLQNTIQQVQQGYQSLYNQALNLKNIGQDAGGSTSALLQQLISTAGTASALTYSGQNIATQFQQTYPGYTPGANYGQQYANARNTTNQNIQNQLQNIGLQASNFQTEAMALNSARQLSQTAGGNLGAIQAGNQISGMVVQQLQLMRQTAMDQQQSQAAYLMQQQTANTNTNAQATDQANAYIGQPPTTVGSGFVMDPNAPIPTYH